LRLRASRHAKGEQQGERQVQKTRFHSSLKTPNSAVEFPSQGLWMLFDLCFFNKSPGPPGGYWSRSGACNPTGGGTKSSSISATLKI